MKKNNPPMQAAREVLLPGSFVLVLVVDLHLL
jgi:hypothetical protein